MSNPVVTVCLVLITVGIWLALAFLVAAALQLRRTALAVEVLSYRVSDSVERLRSATGLLDDFARNVQSGWLRALSLGLSAATTIWSGRREETPAGNGRG